MSIWHIGPESSPLFYDDANQSVCVPPAFKTGVGSPFMSNHDAGPVGNVVHIFLTLSH